MKIVHRISFNASDSQRMELKRLGLCFTEIAGVGVITLEYAESDPKWPLLASLSTRWQTVEFVTTQFSRTELGAANVLAMQATGHHGYPQPEDNFGYKTITYDDSEYCPKCGTGLEQKAPFRMRREPKWGSKEILQMNWVFDEFFVTVDAWKNIFSTFQVEALPVLEHRTGNVLKSVVQLKIIERTRAKVAAESLELAGLCPECHRVKFNAHTRGPFPFVEIPEGAHMAKTHEYFGSGGSAWRQVVISAPLYRAMIAHKTKGACFQVVAGVENKGGAGNGRQCARADPRDKNLT